MLLGVVHIIMRSKKMTIFIFGDPANRIELVVSHNGAGTTALAHSPRCPEHFALIGTAINEIAQKDNVSFWVLVKAINFTIIK
jgi:hypothetical protein